jgi:hypothetical protein
MNHRLAYPLAALVLLAGLGCASSFVDPTGRQNSLDTSQREYTNFIRWGEIKRASVYVEPEYLEEFLSYAPLFEDIRITDADFDQPGLDPSQDTAAVEITYYAYSLTSMQEKRVVETQNWTRHDGVKNRWLVRPEIAAIVEAFQASAN